MKPSRHCVGAALRCSCSKYRANASERCKPALWKLRPPCLPLALGERFVGGRWEREATLVIPTGLQPGETVEVDWRDVEAASSERVVAR